MIGRADEDTGASVIIPLSHMHVHRGRMYEVSYKTPDGAGLADNAAIDFLFRANGIHCHFSFGAIAANPIEITLYESPTITNVGTSLSVVGLNRVRTIAPTSTVFRAPTVSAVGNQIQNLLQVWGITSLTPAFNDTAWILRVDTDYLVRVINRGGATQDIGMVIQWFEE